jgi:hypothetical protein
MTAQVNQNKQVTLNEVYQQSEQNCTASCSNVQSGNTVFLDGTTTGDITFKQVCSASATCVMNNTVESVLESLQSLKQQNKTEANLFGGGFNHMSVNLNLSEQELNNRVKQIIGTNCEAVVDNLQSDNLVYARNSTTGNITFEQNGNAQADCIMTNLAIAKANLKQQADQSNSTVAGGTAALIMFALIAIAGAVLAYMSKKDKKAEEDKKAADQRRQSSGGATRNFSSLTSRRSK